MMHPDKVNLIAEALVRLVNAAAGYLESKFGEPPAASTRGRPAGSKNKNTPEAGAATPDLSVNTNANTGTVTPTPGVVAGAQNVTPNVNAQTAQPIVEASPAVGPQYDDVKALVFKVAETKGRDVALATLAKLGVTKGQDLKPEQYPEAARLLNEALNAVELA